MKIIKSICIWIGIIICSMFSLISMAAVLIEPDSLSVCMLLSFIFWLLLLISKISKPSSWLYKLSFLHPLSFLIGIALIFLGAALAPECPHEWNKYNSIPVSCVTDGTDYYKCTLCGSTKQEVGDKAKGHNWQTQTIVNPTCVADGTQLLTCQACKTETYNNIKAGPEFCHYILDNEIAPTYTEPGKKIFKCDACQKTKQENFGLIQAPITFKTKYYDKDFLGGVTVTVEVTNHTDKVIKYIEYQMYFYNDVGDIIYSDLDIFSGPTCWTITGPVNPNSSKTFAGCGFYNHNYNGIHSVHKIVITYMDETSQVIENKDFDQYTENLIQ